MQINADFNQTIIIPSEQMEWSKSPVKGVHRAMLDRIGGEHARATSLVRYAPSAHFPLHEHPNGEEILVLEGDFNDEHGAYPAGTYLRNPDGSAHTPFSNEGCLLLVKLQQFSPDDQQQIRLVTPAIQWHKVDETVSSLPLHHHGTERVQIVELQPGTKLPICPEKGGHEIVVLSGSLDHAQGRLGPHSWLRFGAHAHDQIQSNEVTRLYWKSGHLPSS
jgi:anti-sigma factor ChrR (cupin superfamily)